MKNLFKPILIFFVVFFCLYSNSVSSQEHKLFIGPRFQKSVSLYNENGINLQYTNPKLLQSRLYLGFTYISTRFGSAIASNAIKQDNLLFSGTYFFRPDKKLQPFSSLNTGWFTADYESEIFNSLPNSSPLVSIEGGIAYHPITPIRISTSLGLNMITGDGYKGPGTIFPVFYQLTIGWNILN
jgi:hypothetical protein